MSAATEPGDPIADGPIADGAAGDAETLVGLLRARGWMLAAAESLTGGLVASAIVDVPGASAVFGGGVVAYATPLKASLLGVDRGLLDVHGAVHPEVARQMAEGVRLACAVDGRPADVGVSTTGIAGPDSPDGQPVGTVHIGVATPEGGSIRSVVLAGTRAQIRRAAVGVALGALREALELREVPERERGNSCRGTTVGTGNSHTFDTVGDYSLEHRHCKVGHPVNTETTREGSDR